MSHLKCWKLTEIWVSPSSLLAKLKWNEFSNNSLKGAPNLAHDFLRTAELSSELCEKCHVCSFLLPRVLLCSIGMETFLFSPLFRRNACFLDVFYVGVLHAVNVPCFLPCWKWTFLGLSHKNKEVLGSRANFFLLTRQHCAICVQIQVNK